MSCIVCSAPTRPVGKRYDDRYGYPGAYELLYCERCRHTQLAVSMTGPEIARLYTDFYPRSARSLDDWQAPVEEGGIGAWWRGVRASAFRWVPRGVRVLDIGCGFGESLGYHAARGCEAHGVEADANILRVAQRYGLNARHGLFGPSHYETASFDYVTLDQVIEHVSDPNALLQGVHQVLKPGGHLVVATPNGASWGARLFGRRWIHWHAPYHQQFFTRDSLARAAAANGFVIERFATVTNSSWLGFQGGHLATFPAQGVPSAFWSSKGMRTLPQRVALKFFHLIDKFGVNHLVTRAFDAIGVGDNMVCLLRKRA